MVWPKQMIAHTALVGVCCAVDPDGLLLELVQMKSSSDWPSRDIMALAVGLAVGSMACLLGVHRLYRR